MNETTKAILSAELREAVSKAKALRSKIKSIEESLAQARERLNGYLQVQADLQDELDKADIVLPERLAETDLNAQEPVEDASEKLQSVHAPARSGKKKGR